jgi:hypothetical protein
MRARRDPYVVWIDAKAVAFAWIGALLFPLIVHIPKERPMFWICAALGVLVTATIIDGVRAQRSGATSDFLAKGVVPAILLVAGGVLSAISA